MNGKKIEGQASNAMSISQPPAKKLTVVNRLVPMTGPRPRRSSQPKLATSSALPNTAGITVMKLKVVQTVYWKVVKMLMPRYDQFWVRRLIVSKSHQTGAEIRNSPIYFRQLRVSRDVPVRQ